MSQPGSQLVRTSVLCRGASDNYILALYQIFRIIPFLLVGSVSREKEGGGAGGGLGAISKLVQFRMRLLVRDIGVFVENPLNCIFIVAFWVLGESYFLRLARYTHLSLLTSPAYLAPLLPSIFTYSMIPPGLLNIFTYLGLRLPSLRMVPHH